MYNFLSSFVAESKILDEKNSSADVDQSSFNENKLNFLSAAEYKNLLMETMKKLKEDFSLLESEIDCVYKLKRSNVDDLNVKMETIKELSNLVSRKKEKLALSYDKKAQKKEIKLESEKNGDETKEIDGENIRDAIRKPRLSDYDFSQETLALIKNDVVANNSNIKPPNFNEYGFYSKTLNNTAKKMSEKKKILDRKSIKMTANFNYNDKITPVICVSDSDAAGSSSDPKNVPITKESLMHSGSLDGSLIKLTPHCELDYNFSNGHKLQNPDFDSAGEDTTSITIIERPQMPHIEANLDVGPAEIIKPEFPKLLARELYDSPVNEPIKPTIGVGAFKPVQKSDRRATTFNVNNGDKRDVRRSVLFDMNVTYVVSKTDETSDQNFGKILPLTRNEYSSLEPFIAMKISFTEVNEAVEKINLYLETNDTNVLNKMDFVEILPGSDNLNFYYTLILTKFGRLKKLQAEETFFECL